METQFLTQASKYTLGGKRAHPTNGAGKTGCTLQNNEIRSNPLTFHKNLSKVDNFNFKILKKPLILNEKC